MFTGIVQDIGEITAIDFRLFSNGGCSTDLSFAVLERAMLHADNAYFIPHFRATGRVSGTITYGEIEIECGGNRPLLL